MNRILTAVIALSLSTASLFEADAQRRSSGRPGMNRSFEMSEKTQKEWANLQTELEKKDPEGFREIKKLAETNLPAAFNKMQRLAAKAGLKTPRPNFSRSNMSRRNNGEGPGREGFGRREGMRGRSFGGPRMNNAGQKRTEVEAKIAEKFPAEYAAYKKAVEENRLKLKDLAAKSGEKLPANAEEMAFVTKKYEKELEGLQWRERFAKLRELLEKEGYEFSFGFSGTPGSFRSPADTPRPAPPPKRDFSRNELARKAKQQYPEEWQEYMLLNRKDKQAAKAKLEELLKKVQ
ncbi:MAG: hypothetical protein IKA79_06955 [Lentisphaeria bacterium]|nr:hypothetical protein [Lentisphaeria bacterium]